MLFAITGVRGVGKGSVINESMKRAKSSFTLVRFGDYMLENAKEEGLVSNRKELLELNKEAQKEIQKQASKEIKKLKNEPLILDTHCTVKTPQGYLPGMPKWVLERLKPDYIVIIEADPSEILVRRMKEEEKFDDIGSEESIESHQDINRAISQSYSSISGSVVKIIKNHDGGFEEAVKNLKDILVDTR